MPWPWMNKSGYQRIIMRVNNLYSKVILCTAILICVYTALSFALDIGDIKRHFLSSDYDLVIRQAEALIAQDRYSSELYYFLGLSYLKKMEYKKAEDSFSFVVNNHGDKKFKEESKIALADVYYLRGEIKESKALYEQFLEQYPKTKFKEEVLNKIKVLSRKADSLYFNQREETFSVQVGSFSNINNARNLTRKLIAGGLPAYMEKMFVSGREVYPVRVGKFLTRQEAEQFSKKLVRQGYPVKICP